jgi:sterol desaturase/sphingolipid hydroxylase (fatty acid hydroxylase superfamily)
LAHDSFGFYWLAFFGAIITRYFIVAAGTHWFCYAVLKSTLNQGTTLKAPGWKSIRKDAELSLSSAVIFAFCAALVMTAYDAHLTQLYSDLDQYGLWYLGCSFWLVLLVQDTYFYFMHRLFHHPLLFKAFHWGHHRSGDPTPWTSFAFDPPEAIAQALFLVAIVFVIPLHFITLLSILITMTAWGIFNHMGISLFPSSRVTQGLGKWFIGCQHHLTHHRNYRVHYGLYFTHWDRWLGTEAKPRQNVNASQIQRGSDHDDV